MKPLDKQQQTVLEFMAQFERDTGHAPTVREIMAACGIKSTAADVGAP